jgi:hypothetical protein
MDLFRMFATGVSLPALFALSLGTAIAQSDEELIAEAESAGPPGVAKNATIMAFDEDGSMRTLREGTNNFTCMADDPSPGHNPMCMDANAMAWAEAWINKTEPPKGKVGFGYMLAGGGTPSNVDPYATEPPGGGEPAAEPPHVMIFNLPEPAADYPRPDEEVEMSQPWVMWKDTPYEHLMIPVE